MNGYKIFSCVSLVLLFNGPLIGSQDSFKLGKLDLSKSSSEDPFKGSELDNEMPESPHKQEQSSNMWLLPAGIAIAGATAACYYCISSYWSTPKSTPKCTPKVESKKVPEFQQPEFVETDNIVPPNTLIACEKTTPTSNDSNRTIIAEEFITYTEHRRIIHYADFTHFPETFEKKQNKEL